MLAHELVTTFVDTQLMKVDRVSMAVSVEARVPFMDYRVVEFAFTLPPDLKVRGKRGNTFFAGSSTDTFPKHCIGDPRWGSICR